MTITIELLREDALPLLRYLERLKLLKLVLPETPHSRQANQKSRFAGRISQDTAGQLHQQLIQLREEWR